MRKYIIKHLTLPLMLATIIGCTEDPISVAAGKLPDEVPMNSIGGILYSEKSLTNKLVINLSQEEASATDAIYYTLTKPATNAVTVTAIADEKLVDTYNSINLTNLKAMPAANVQFEGSGTLTVAAGKQTSEKIKITISTHGLEAETVYLLPITVAQAPTGVQVHAEKQILYYGVNIREKITTIYPLGPSISAEMPPLLPNLFTVFYVNTEFYQPIIADVYGITKVDNKNFTSTLYTVGNIVNLRIVTVDYNSENKRALLNLSSDIRYVLEHADKYIRRLQEHGRKVCLCIEGGGKGLGFCNMSDAQIADFSKQVKDVIELYQLDGVNLWDQGSGYGKEGMPAMNTTSYPKLIKALHNALPGKLLTLLDKGEPTEYFYDTNLCGEIEVGRYIDYAWHGYAAEDEEVQMIDPWKSEQSDSKYTRKPIAGLNPDHYGNINIARYPNNKPSFSSANTKKIIMWKMAQKKNNNILVYGNDLTANEQNSYEGAIQTMISMIGNFMDDGKLWGTPPWGGVEMAIQGDYTYSNQYLDYRLNLTYKVYAKDW